MFNKQKKGRRNKSEWPNMGPVELTRLLANRVGRIEVLKMEIRELQKLIDEKTRWNPNQDIKRLERRKLFQIPRSC